MRLGPTELVIILLIVLVLFGAKRLPGLASSVGTSIKEFRNATKELDEDEEAGEGAANGSETDPDARD